MNLHNQSRNLRATFYRVKIRFSLMDDTIIIIYS